ncbi:MAG: Mov34/MPN/PAD-1 family protein [Leptolyngbyaceae cyanobacterium MO_188.B28]|nr:Mov34/MPN/PAD-1 family protein [Leptolyngbyaceae cyanobacterium MO_188.B28]
MMSLIQHHFITDRRLPDFSGAAFSYWVGGNGLFAAARRPHLEAVVPITLFSQPVRGLLPVTPYLAFTPQLPQSLLSEMYQQALEAQDNQGRLLEILFHITWDDAAETWRLIIPRQQQTPTQCTPLDSSTDNVIAEIHSHGSTGAFFSDQDNQDEFGFNLYGVLGRICERQPEFILRVCVYRHCWHVPAKTVFEDIPSWVTDISLQTEPVFYFNGDFATGESPCN